MGFLLREIKRPRWLKREELPWLAEGELQADVLADLKTNDNRLSVWSIDDQKLNLDRVIAAVAVTRDHIEKLDYALFQDDTLSALSIQIEPTKGTTPDE